jgi:cyclopropane-fatty-acyl-phospholipid synthase
MSYTHRILKHLLFKNLEAGIVKGTLHVTTPDRETRSFIGSQPGSEGHWQIRDFNVIKALSSRGDIGLGETYCEGLWDAPDLDALFRVFIDNIDDLDRYANGHPIMQFWFRMLNTVIRRNSVKGSRENISAHYDVGNPFYRLWLDPSMTYSSALYATPDMSLQQAQQQKYQRILDRITPDRQKILEVGCGWGGFAEEAVNTGHKLTALTVSKQQHDYALQRVPNRADIRLQDYREIKGKFDAITSIEMFEAVGKQYWPSYFAKIKECLSTDGVAMVQTITVKDDAFDAYITRSDYIRHYVFPGGMLPSTAVFRKSAENAGLVCRDVYHFGLDYARTLREWLAQFDANESGIRALGYGNAFIRSWRLYLSMCAASFACGRTSVMQVEMAHA